MDNRLFRIPVKLVLYLSSVQINVLLRAFLEDAHSFYSQGFRDRQVLPSLPQSLVEENLTLRTELRVSRHHGLALHCLDSEKKSLSYAVKCQ